MENNKLLVAKLSVLTEFIQFGIDVYVSSSPKYNFDIIIADFGNKSQKIRVLFNVDSDDNDKTIYMIPKTENNGTDINYYALYNDEEHVVYLVPNNGNYKNKIKVFYEKSDMDNKKNSIYGEDYKFDEIILPFIEEMIETEGVYVINTKSE